MWIYQSSFWQEASYDELAAVTQQHDIATSLCCASQKLVLRRALNVIRISSYWPHDSGHAHEKLFLIH